MENNNDNERKNGIAYKVGYTFGVVAIACATVLLVAFTAKCLSWLLF